MATTNPSSSKDADEEETSSQESGLDHDMDAYRRACLLTGTNPNDATMPESDSSDNDDFDLVRKLEERFSLPIDMNEAPIFLKPLKTLPPVGSDDDDDDDDDFETLRAIEKRFSKYQSDAVEKSTLSHLNNDVLDIDTSIAQEEEEKASKTLFLNSNHPEGLDKELPVSEEDCNTIQPVDSSGNAGYQDEPFGLSWHQSEASDSSLPKEAHIFIDAIKKNRLYQKTIRNQLLEIEAKIEENRKLLARAKILKDYQVACKKRTGKALAQKKDARVQLISVPKSRKSLISKVNDKKLHALCFGPADNSHVANYRMVLEKFPVSLRRERWSTAEKENLKKGIEQQFQEMLVAKSMEGHSDSDESLGDSNALDRIIATIKDLQILPEQIRAFLPKVNWEQLASTYVVGRSGAECEARWLNSEDPLINHNPWTKDEDKKLLYILQQRGELHNWIEIATLLETNRTPFQCIARYQRSLNAQIMKRDWTEEEDSQLRAAVEVYGENDWQTVASCLEGRTGTQCSNRWNKTLIPARQKVGRWTLEEDKHLKVTVMLFGPRAWHKIAQFVPGRTQVQCRERWLNVLDPSLNLEAWTEEEDSRLKAAIAEYGHCWSKVAASVPPRTDNQCRRRWKVLLPHEVRVLQAARKVQKVALMSNFVDRGEERPNLDPSDFLPISTLLEDKPGSTKEKTKKRKRPSKKQQKDVTLGEDGPTELTSKRSRTKPQTSPKGIKDGDLENTDVDNAAPKKKTTRRSHLKNNRRSERASSNQELSLSSQHSGLSLINDETFGEKNAVSKKKKSRKLCSKRNKCIIAAPGQQDLLLYPEPSTVLRITSCEDDETFEGDATGETQNMPMLHSEKSVYVEPAQGRQDLSSSPDSSNLLRLTNSDNTEPLVGVDVPAMSSERNRSTESAECRQGLLSCPEQLRGSRITHCNSEETFEVDGSTLRMRKEPGRPSKRKRRTEPAQEHNDVLPDISTHLNISNSHDTESFSTVDTTSKRKRVPNRRFLDYVV